MGWRLQHSSVLMLSVTAVYQQCWLMGQFSGPTAFSDLPCCHHPRVAPWDIALTCPFAFSQQFKDDCCLMVYANKLIVLAEVSWVWDLHWPHTKPRIDRSTSKREVQTGQGKGHCRLIKPVTTRRTLFNFWCQKRQPRLAGKSPWK